MNVKKMILSSMLITNALTIFIIEAQLPPIVPIPGIKLGLANVVTLFAIYLLGYKEEMCIRARLVSVLRYAKEQPQLLESQGNGQFSGSMEQGVSFVVTARNKGTVESITVDQYHIKCL